MSELKPCPFCGGVDIKTFEMVLLTSEFWTECRNCDARGPKAESKDRAYERWSERDVECTRVEFKKLVKRAMDE